jgi:Zn-dependent protease
MILAITVHEAAHGWIAKRLGDPTADIMGRVTLNPLKHIDPVGTVLVPIGAYLLTGFMFGWAKPVPVDFNNLTHPKRDIGLVALAGPGANLMMALIWSVIVFVGAMGRYHLGELGLSLLLMGVAGVVINAVWIALNLLPISPLDGGRVVYSLLPLKLLRFLYRLEIYGLIAALMLLAAGLPFKLAQLFSRVEFYGLMAVFILLGTGMLHNILWPVIEFIIALLPASDIVRLWIPVIF